MKAYFQLQFRLFNRAIQSIGMPPLLGYVALLAVFIGSSLLLFARTEFAPYLYILLALSMMGRLGEQRRNDFLQMHFPAPQYRLIRLAETENLIGLARVDCLEVDDAAPDVETDPDPAADSDTEQ